MRNQYPAGKATTKSLNTGVTSGSIVAAATGYLVYATTDGGSSFFLQTASPVPVASSILITSINTGLGSQPTSNTAGILPPGQPGTGNAFLLTPNTGGSLTSGGTYMVGVAYTTRSGITLMSSPQSITLGAGFTSFKVDLVGPSLTGLVTVELIVPSLEDWHVTRYAVFVSTSASTPSVNLYVDSVGLLNLLDTTALGAQNSANADLYLRPGQSMIAQWTLADVGATATLSVFGEKTS